MAHTTTTTTTISAAALLTKKQLAILGNLNELDRKGLTLVALAGKGQAAKLSAGVVSDLEMVDALASFQRSGCGNVRPFAVLINSLTGQFTDGKTLAPCPTRKADFLNYGATVYAWAIGTENEKTQAVRLNVSRQVSAIVRQVQAAADAYFAEKQAAAAATEQAAELALMVANGQITQGEAAALA
jgi:hypothetical protein